MTFKQAVDRLGTWAVTGVTTNYGNDDVPGMIAPAELPALLLLGAQGGSKGLAPFDLEATTAGFTVFVNHLLLIRGAGMGRPQESFYDGVTLVDNYITKVKTDWTLNGYLAEPLQIGGARWQPFTLGTTTYWAIVFPHRWVLAL